jgi:hypothetical protein
LALRCPHLRMPSSLARDVLHHSADSMLLRAERGTKELPGRDSTASTVSTHPATIGKEVAARFSCPAQMRTVWTLEATDPKKPDPNAPPPEPSQWFVAIAAPRRTAGGRSEAREWMDCKSVIGFAQPRFLVLIATQLTQHEESTEYGERRATPSESLSSHHQPLPANRTGARANLLQPALITSRTPMGPDPPDIQDSRSHNLPTRRKEPSFCLHTIDTREHSRGLFLAPQTHPAGFGAEPPIQTTSTTATVSNTTGLPRLCNSTNRESRHCWSAFDISTLSLSIYLRAVRIQADLMPSSR